MKTEKQRNRETEKEKNRETGKQKNKMDQSDQNSIIARSLAECCRTLFGLSAAGAKAGAETC